MESDSTVITVDDSDAVSHVSDTTVGSPIRHVGSGLFPELKRCRYNELYSDDIRISPTIPDQDQSSHKIASNGPSDTDSTTSESLLILKHKQEKSQELDDHSNVIKKHDDLLLTHSPFFDFDSEINTCHISYKNETNMKVASLLETKTEIVLNGKENRDAESCNHSNNVYVSADLEMTTEVGTGETLVKTEAICDSIPLERMLCETKGSERGACITAQENPTDLDNDTEPNQVNSPLSGNEEKNLEEASEEYLMKPKLEITNNNFISMINYDKNLGTDYTDNKTTNDAMKRDVIMVNYHISDNDNVKNAHAMICKVTMHNSNDLTKGVTITEDNNSSDAITVNEESMNKTKCQKDKLLSNDDPMDRWKLIEHGPLLVLKPLNKENNKSLTRGSPEEDVENDNRESTFNEMKNNNSILNDSLLNIDVSFKMYDIPSSKGIPSNKENLLVIDTQAQNDKILQNNERPVDGSVENEKNYKTIEMNKTEYDRESKTVLNESQSSISTMNPDDLYNYIHDLNLTSVGDNLKECNQQPTCRRTGMEGGNFQTTVANKADTYKENSYLLQSVFPNEPVYCPYIANPKSGGQVEILKSVSYPEKPINEASTFSNVKADQFFEQSNTLLRTIQGDELLNKTDQQPLESENHTHSKITKTMGSEIKEIRAQTCIPLNQTNSKSAQTGVTTFEQVTTDKHDENIENNIHEGSESLLIDYSTKYSDKNMQSIKPEDSSRLHQKIEQSEALKDNSEFINIDTDRIVNVLDTHQGLEKNTNVENDLETSKSKRSNDSYTQSKHTSNCIKIIKDLDNAMTAGSSKNYSVIDANVITPRNITSIYNPTTDINFPKKTLFSSKSKDYVLKELQQNPFVPPSLSTIQAKSKNIDLRTHSNRMVTSFKETSYPTSQKNPEIRTSIYLNTVPHVSHTAIDNGNTTKVVKEERKEFGEGISKTETRDLGQSDTHKSEANILSNAKNTSMTEAQEINETTSSCLHQVQNGPRRSNRVSREPDRLISSSDDTMMGIRNRSIASEHSLENTRHLQNMATYEKLKIEYESIEELVVDGSHLTTDIIKQCSKTMKEAQKRLMNFLSLAKAEMTFLTSQSKVTTLPKDLKALLKTKLTLLSERQKKLKTLYSTHFSLQSRIKSLASRKVTINKLETENTFINDLRIPPKKTIPLSQSTISSGESSKERTSKIEYIASDADKGYHIIVKDAISSGSQISNKTLFDKDKQDTKQPHNSQSLTNLPLESTNQVLTATSVNGSYVFIPMYRERQPPQPNQSQDSNRFIQQNLEEGTSMFSTHSEQDIIAPNEIGSLAMPVKNKKNIPIIPDVPQNQTIRMINAPISQIKDTGKTVQTSSLEVTTNPKTSFPQSENSKNVPLDEVHSSIRKNDDDILELILSCLDRESASQHQAIDNANFLPLDLSKKVVPCSPNNKCKEQNVCQQAGETQSVGMKRKSNEVFKIQSKTCLIGTDQNITRGTINQQYSSLSNDQDQGSHKSAFKSPPVTNPVSVTVIQTNNLECASEEEKKGAQKTPFEKCAKNVPVSAKTNNSPSPSVASFTSGISSSSRWFLKKMKGKAVKISQAKMKKDYQQTTTVESHGRPLQKIFVHRASSIPLKTNPNAKTIVKASLLDASPKLMPVMIKAQSNARQRTKGETATQTKLIEVTAVDKLRQSTGVHSVMKPTSGQSTYNYPTNHVQKVSEYWKVSSYPNLKVMIKMGLMKPGKNRLAINYLRKTFLGSLLESGNILDSDGNIFYSPMKWFTHVTGASFCRKATAYKKVYFEGRSLTAIIQEYEKKSDVFSVSSWTKDGSKHEKESSDVANSVNDLRCEIFASKDMPLCNAISAPIPRYTFIPDGANVDERKLNTMNTLHHPDNNETAQPLQPDENKSIMKPFTPKFDNILVIDDREIFYSTELDDEFWKKPFKELTFSKQMWNEVDNWD